MFKAIESKKKILLIISVIELVFIVIIFFKISESEYNFRGLGTAENPYQINTIEDFMNFSNMVNEGLPFSNVYFAQKADLDFENVEFKPIGIDVDGDRNFSGIYDGNGFSIKNLYFVSDHDEDAGLFYSLDGTVINIELIDCILGGSRVGGIAAHVSRSGHVLNCSVSGSLKGYEVGGIAGLSNGEISNCVAYVHIDASKQDGIAIYNKKYSRGRVENSYSNVESKYGRNKLTGETLKKLNVFANDASSKAIGYNNWIVDNGFFFLEE